MATGRSVRIDELIREGIDNGKKFTPEDMIAFQQDSVDVFARNMIPTVVALCEATSSDLTRDQQENLHVALSYYRDWDGDMAEDSIAGSIHMHYFLNFYKSLFHKQEKGGEEARLFISDGYAFQQTYQRILTEVLAQGPQSHFQTFCEDAYPEYAGINYCAYNVARSMADAKSLLHWRVSKNPKDWVWRNIHVREYANLPWSKTPLAFLFHRTVPMSGNNNSLNVSGVKMLKNRNNVVFEAIHVASYKMVVSFVDKENPKRDFNLYSIDTGMNGNPFQGHYFDMNNDHIYGRL